MMKYSWLGLYVILAPIALASPVMAANWTVDYPHSKLGFTATQGSASFDGQFNTYEASIDFDPANPADGHLVVIVDMASVAAGNAERNGTLPQPDWFDTKTFPKAVFTSTSIAATTPNCYEAKANLVMKGLSRPVTLPFCLAPDGDATRATGKLALLRSDFNIGTGQWAGEDTVKHAVDVTVDIRAKQTMATPLAPPAPAPVEPATP